ncbi:riboflavin synthase [soil metagenome]
MFTGIIEAQGRIGAVEDRAHLRVFRIDTPEGFPDDVSIGGSIAVDGACLTAVQVGSDHFIVEAIRQTLDRTVAGRYEPGTVVNLEKAMTMGRRLDGHIVQGHVDGMGKITQILDDGDAWRLHFHIPDSIHRGTILHGSITLNGVSLTVNGLEDPHHLEVGIIPHTWAHTNLSRLEPGEPVNVEGDLIGKYVARWMAGRDTPPLS